MSSQCCTVVAALLIFAVFSVSTVEPALANGSETRTWKYLGYYISKIGGAKAFKLSGFGVPVVNLPTPSTAPSPSTPHFQVIPPQVPSSFTVSPDTAVFPDFPAISDNPQPLPTMFVTQSASDAPTPSPTIGPPPSSLFVDATQQAATIGPVDILPVPSIGPPPDSNPPAGPQASVAPSPGLDSAASIFPLPSTPSSFPTAPPFNDNAISSLPDIVFPSNVPATTVSALPLPTGLTSGTFLSPNIIPLAQAPATTGTLTTGVVQCGCVEAGTCVSSAGVGGVISVRIVTQSPSISCPAGQQYCCTQAAAPQQSTCGLPNVIPGVFPSANQANFGEFPWSGIILTGQNQYIGGAALIDNTHLLTAAHLVASFGNGAGLKVRLGEWDLTGTYEPSQFVDIPILNIVVHPSFVASTLQNDMAVIILQAPATLVANPTPQVNTVCLPATGDDFTGQTCLVAGWGKDSFNGNYQNIIKKVDVPVLGEADCQQRLRQTRLGQQWALDTTSFVCAGGVISKDSCQGDGGNALVCLKDGRYVVAGITAGGVECGQSNVPGLYAKVVSYLPWIASQIAASTPQQPVGTIDPRRQG